MSNKRHPVTQEIPTTLGALGRTRKHRGLRRNAFLRIPHLPSPGFQETMLSGFSRYSRRRPLPPPPTPPRHAVPEYVWAHVTQRSLGLHTLQLQGFPAAPACSSPVLPGLHSGQKLGVSLDGRCSHIQSLVKLLGPPLGNPGPLPCVCCTQLPLKARRGKVTAEWGNLTDTTSASDQGHVDCHSHTDSRQP